MVLLKWTLRKACYKNQLQGGVQWPIRDEARSDVIRYIEMFYNSHHLHSFLGYKNPNVFENIFFGKSRLTGCPFLLDQIIPPLFWVNNGLEVFYTIRVKINDE